MIKKTLNIELASNFQKVTFSLDVEEETENALIARAINLVNMFGSEVQVNTLITTPAVKDDLATEKQWEILKKFNLTKGLDKNLTKKEAGKIIKESIANAQ